MARIDPATAVGYVLKRAAVALRVAMDAALNAHGLTTPQYSCLEQLAHRPGRTNAELARGTFVTRQAMHQLLAGLRDADLVRGDGAGRFERFALTAEGEARIAGASAAVAGVQDRMLAGLDEDEQRRLHADLAACVKALTPTA